MRTRIARLLGLSALSLSMALGSVVINPVKVEAAAAMPQMQGAGANYCINATNNPDGFSYFTNTCDGNVTIVVANQRGFWAPELLAPGASEGHETANGPFRYFTCAGTYVPHDSMNQTWYPGFNSEYVCRAN
jgi:hypothetical protein